MSDAALAGTVARCADPPALSNLEFLPGWIVYAPVIAQWLALGLWHRDLSLPTAANPRIETGGLCGERKSEILAQAGVVPGAPVAPWITLTAGAGALADATAAMRQAALSLPLVVKPDIGCNGTGVRLARDRPALADALGAFRPGTALLLQAFVDLAGEAGIFYIRRPEDCAGRITSLTLKHAPSVIGDGASTLRALIEADPRHRHLVHLYAPRLAARLHSIPSAGETVPLVFAGNHCKGSIFTDGAAHITPALTARIDAIARALPDFHFGRFDVRFATLPALRRGDDFSIIEINGVGAEATHIWDRSKTLADIWRDQLRHYAAAWTIAATLRRRGARPSGLRAMYRAWLRQRRLMAGYPLND